MGCRVEARVLRDWVIEGSVQYAGAVLDLDAHLVERLEPDEIVVRVHEEDYRDRVEDRYPESANQESAIRDVMVFTPVYRLEERTVDAVLGLQWDKAISWVFQTDNPNEIDGDIEREGAARWRGVLNHLHQYQRGREVFLASRSDAMLIVESDMLPPRDALKTMVEVMERGMDIVYGVYRFRQSDVINVHELLPDGQRVIGQNLSVRPHLLKRAVKLGVYPCSGIGFGCTLIRREVLEAVPLRIDAMNSSHCDTYFAKDALEKGFRQAADFRVICGHIDYDGSVKWPSLPEVERVQS